MSEVASTFRRRMLLNTVTCWGLGAWAVVLGAIAVPALLHALGASRFGVWALLQTFSASTGWASIATVGIGVAATRRVAADLQSDPTASNAILTLFGIVGLVLAVSWTVTAPLWLPSLLDLDPTMRSDVLATIPWIGAQLSCETLLVGVTSLLEGSLRVDLARIVDGVRRALVLGVTVLVATRGGTLENVVAAGAAATALAAGGGVILSVRVTGVRPSWRVRRVRSLLYDARSTTVLNLSGVVHRSMDRMLVGFSFGPAAVVGVEIASRLRDVAALVLTTSSYTAVSASAWLRARRDEERLRDLVEFGTLATVTVTWSAIALAAVFRHEILDVWVGEHDRVVAEFALLALLYLAIETPQQVGANVLTGIGSLRRFTVAAWCGVVANLVASIVLLERHGPVGVFQGTLVGTAIVVPLAMRAIADVTGAPVGVFVRRAILPAVPCVATVVAISTLARLLPTGSLGTLLIGSAVALGGGAAVALRYTLTPGELRSRLAPREAQSSERRERGRDPVRAASVDE